MMKFFASILAFFCLSFSLLAQDNTLSNVRYTPEDVSRFNEIVDSFQSQKEMPLSSLVIEIAKSMLETPYVASTLEIEPEMLTINMRQTDCILFVEMCLALAQTIKADNPTFERYCDNVRSLRYRGGVVNGYSSRLHYTSEWAHQAASHNILKDIAKECGGEPLDQQFFYMTTHSNAYKQLRNNAELVSQIRVAEENLNAYDYYYIPKAKLKECIHNIKTGDIIGFNSATPGIDIAHVAYAYWQNGELTFIHASYGDHKVVINEMPLVEYTNGIKSHNGLRVFRLQ